MFQKITFRAFLVLLIGFSALFFISKKCSVDYKSRERPRSTIKVCGDLFIERFCVFGQGAFGTDVDSDWLTDMKSFRIYIGTFDQAEGGFTYKCNGDTLYITQRPDALSGNPKGKSVTTIYVINELRKKQNLNDY
jgi:hypothetical protein